MYKHFMYYLFLICGISFFSSLSYSQEMKDQLYMVREEVVKVDAWDKYESTSKQWVDMMVQGGLDLPYVRASQRDDGHYYYLIPISNYAEIDNFPKIFGSAVDKVGKEKWSSFMIENESTIATHRDFIVKLSAQYSYVPKQPRITMEESKFAHWLFFHFKLENRKQVMEILKEWKKLYEDKKINSGYNIWLVDLGLDNNEIILTEYAKDGADFFQTMKENTALVKAEEDALWAKLAPFLLSTEQKYGSLRPDLGYVKK
jgi:hypothetical protein